MECIYCNGETAVVDSRSNPQGVYRRRRCKQCKRSFGTLEQVEGKPQGEAKKEIERHLRGANLRLLQLHEELKATLRLLVGKEAGAK